MGSIGPVSLRAVLVPTVLLLLPLAACGQQPAANPGVLAADPWVRTTDGAKMPEMTAVFVNLTNPKSIVFLAALFPQFIVPHQPQVMQYVVLGATTIIVDIIVMIGYATLAQRIAAWIKGPKQMKALNKVFGSLFMLVGALLASARHA